MAFNVNANYNYLKENVEPNLYQYAYSSQDFPGAVDYRTGQPLLTRIAQRRALDSLDPGKQAARRRIAMEDRIRRESHESRMQALAEMLQRLKFENRFYRNQTESDPVEFRAAQRAVVPPRSGDLGALVDASGGGVSASGQAMAPQMMERAAQQGAPLMDESRHTANSNAKHTANSNAKHTTPASQKTKSGKKRYEEYV